MSVCTFVDDKMLFVDQGHSFYRLPRPITGAVRYTAHSVGHILRTYRMEKSPPETIAGYVCGQRARLPSYVGELSDGHVAAISGKVPEFIIVIYHRLYHIYLSWNSFEVACLAMGSGETVAENLLLLLIMLLAYLVYRLTLGGVYDYLAEHRIFLSSEAT